LRLHEALSCSLLCLCLSPIGGDVSTEIHPFATVRNPSVHQPTIGYSQTLRCSPPHSYPAGSVYWGHSEPESTKLDAIETDDRVLLDYEGWFRFHYRLRRKLQEGKSLVLQQKTVAAYSAKYSALLLALELFQY